MVTRRKLLGFIAAGSAALVPLALSVPLVGYLLAPLLQPRRASFVGVGKVEDFVVNRTTLVRFVDPSLLPWSGASADTAVWVRRRADDAFDVFAVYCTHMGCPVEWRDDSKLFFCPCHGGVFHSDGAVAAGPPIKPLVQREWRITDGTLEVRPGGLPTLEQGP